MAPDYVSQDQCSRIHENESEFKRETNDNFTRLHARIDKIYAAIFGVMLAIIGAIASNVVLSKMTKDQPEIKIVIDKQVLNSIENGADHGKKN